MKIFRWTILCFVFVLSAHASSTNMIGTYSCNEYTLELTYDFDLKVYFANILKSGTNIQKYYGQDFVLYQKSQTCADKLGGHEDSWMLVRTNLIDVCCSPQKIR